jgi:hypothetical protein
MPKVLGICCHPAHIPALEGRVWLFSRTPHRTAQCATVHCMKTHDTHTHNRSFDVLPPRKKQALGKGKAGIFYLSLHRTTTHRGDGPPIPEPNRSTPSFSARPRASGGRIAVSISRQLLELATGARKRLLEPPNLDTASQRWVGGRNGDPRGCYRE